MRPLRIAVVAVLLALSISSTPGAEWGFGSLRIEGFDGFSEVPTQKPPRRLINSDGTEVLISVFRIAPEAEAKVYGGDAEKRLRMHEEGAQRVYERSAQRNEATIPLAREKLSDGTVLISGAVRKSGLFSSGFFLIYMVVAPAERIAMLTVEGRGDPKVEYERYKSHFSSVRWVD